MDDRVRRNAPVVAAVLVVLAIPALLAWVNWRADQDDPVASPAAAPASPVAVSPAASPLAGRGISHLSAASSDENTVGSPAAPPERGRTPRARDRDRQGRPQRDRSDGSRPGSATGSRPNRRRRRCELAADRSRLTAGTNRAARRQRGLPTPDHRSNDGSRRDGLVSPLGNHTHHAWYNARRWGNRHSGGVQLDRAGPV